MSGSTAWRPDFYAATRRHASRLLKREVAALRRPGIRTVVFEPGAVEQQVMGDDMMSRERLHEVIQQSFLGAGARAAEPEVTEALHMAGRRTAQPPLRARSSPSRTRSRPNRNSSP